MARRQGSWEETECLRRRRYQHDLACWAEWRTQQDRLRGLLPRAIDTLERVLETDGPEAVKVALVLVKLSDAAGQPEKPQRVLIDLADPDELAAGLPAGEDRVALPDPGSR